MTENSKEQKWISLKGSVDKLSARITQLPLSSAKSVPTQSAGGTSKGEKNNEQK
ncbi:hypothetical protein M2444_005346 [Paenibacillus sp. PastF-3]|uniref:hypothetical protein n=1 Tax=Paenibacillus sp. PastF-3 TaxID=2940626 RepID=UPI002473B15E|nr:hypothetical protein [Paenibacillus sp. PastF-3]MDH6373514.1 hypothetical protein [Paenibacillus sp. PastF-3]